MDTFCFAHYVTRREELQQSMPIAAAANETYKKAKAAGKGDDDFAAIYEATISK